MDSQSIDPVQATVFYRYLLVVPLDVRGGCSTAVVTVSRVPLGPSFDSPSMPSCCARFGEVT